MSAAAFTLKLASLEKPERDLPEGFNDPAIAPRARCPPLRLDALAAVHAPAASTIWRIETQAAAGIDPKPLCALIDKLDKLKPNVHGVVVVRHGALVFEHHWRGVDQKWGGNLGEVAHGPDVKDDIRSGSKSVVSLLVGIALDRKLITGIDQPVFAFFPERAALRTPAKERITLRHLLTMSSGIAWDESIPYTSPRNGESLMISATDPYRYVLEQPLADEPGKRWNYSGGSTALLGAVVQRTGKQWLPDFAREALFTPLGITDFEWVKMWNGEFAAASGLRLRPRDMAKIGQFALAHGEWKEKDYRVGGMDQAIAPSDVSRRRQSIMATNGGPPRRPTLPPSPNGSRPMG